MPESSVMTRSRIPITEEEYGVKACGEPTEQVACNVRTPEELDEKKDALHPDNPHLVVANH